MGQDSQPQWSDCDWTTCSTWSARSAPWFAHGMIWQCLTRLFFKKLHRSWINYSRYEPAFHSDLRLGKYDTLWDYSLSSSKIQLATIKSKSWVQATFRFSKVGQLHPRLGNSFHLCMVSVIKFHLKIKGHVAWVVAGKGLGEFEQPILPALHSKWSQLPKCSNGH